MSLFNLSEISFLLGRDEQQSVITEKLIQTELKLIVLFGYLPFRFGLVWLLDLEKYQFFGSVGKTQNANIQ